MSTAVEQDDVQLMAEFDFKSPINATVLICDSDEDIHSSTEKDPNNDSKNDSYIFKGTARKSSNKRKKTTRASTNKRLSSAKIKSDENKTRGYTFPNITEPGSQYRAEELMSNHNDNIANRRCDKTIPKEDQSSDSNQIATTSLLVRIKSPIGGEPQRPLPHDQVDVNNKANECVQTLLNIVSDHMIFIMKAYIDYKVFTGTITDKMVLESARKHLQKTKYKLFYMSFSAVANIMLPKEKDLAFMQNFIDNTVKIARSKHLYFKHSDMASVCKEMFSWVKTHVQQPLIVGLLNKEPHSTANTGNTNNVRNLVDCDTANNALDSTYCTSGHTGREVTLNVSSTEVQNNLNVQNVPVRPGAYPASNELRTKAKSTNYLSNYPVQDAPLMQSVLTPSVELRTNANTANCMSHYPVQNTPSTQSLLTPSVELRTNVNTANCMSHYPVQNTPSTQSLLTPSVELRNNVNTTNCISHYPVQNVPSLQSLLTPSVELRTNVNTANCMSHYPVQNTPSTQSLLTPSVELRTNVNTTNCISHYPVQNLPSLQSLLTPSVELRTNVNTTNCISRYPVQNTSTIQSLLTPIVELRTNENSINCISHYTEQKTLSTQSVPSDKLETNANLSNNISQYHVQNVTPIQSLLPSREQLKINAKSTNYTSHGLVQNVPTESVLVLPPHRDGLKKNATSTNYLQEFEHFNSSYSYYQQVSKNKSKNHQSSNVRVQRESHHHPTHSSHTSRPPPYNSHTRHYDTVTPQNYSQNQIVNSNHCDNIQVVQESVDVNRSLSRDSGFMSPAPLTCTPTDRMLNSPRYDQMDSPSTLTPMITHVTSLNPGVAYIKDGICHVCGKLTKDKCLGCVKIYYCSHQCQINDWKNHIYICNL